MEKRLFRVTATEYSKNGEILRKYTSCVLASSEDEARNIFFEDDFIKRVCKEHFVIRVSESDSNIMFF